MLKASGKSLFSSVRLSTPEGYGSCDKPKRAGLYEAGKLLYERGGLDLDKLGEEQQVEVQEDYETCVRALQRAAGGEAGTKKKRGGRKLGADE